MGEYCPDREDEKKRLGFLILDKNAAIGMQVDKEEQKDVIPRRPPVATVERGLQASLELTELNLMHANSTSLLSRSSYAEPFFKVPKMKKKQKVKGRREEDNVGMPRKRVFHEATHSDVEKYEFGVKWNVNIF